MKKALPRLLLALSLLLALCPWAWGAESPGYILGDESAAEMMRAGQAEILEEAAEEVSSEYGCGVYIAVVEDYSAYWDTIEDCADWLYQEYFQSRWKSGVLLTLSMEDQSYCLRSYGSLGKRAVTEEGKGALADTFLDGFEQDGWYAGFSNYLVSSARLLEAARSGEPVGGPSRALDAGTLKDYGTAAVISVVIALGICEFFRRQMKTAREATAAKEYVPALRLSMM